MVQRHHDQVLVVGREDSARLDSEVLPLARPVEERVHECVRPGVRARVGDLRHLSDDEVRVAALDMPLEVAAPPGPEPLGEGREQRGWDARLDGGQPLLADVELAHHVARRLVPLLARHPPASP